MNWHASLDGTDQDLQRLSDLLHDDVNVRRSPDGWIIDAPEIRAAEDASEAKTRALRLVEQVRGLVRLHLGYPVAIKVGGVRRPNLRGSTDVWVFPEPIPLGIGLVGGTHQTGDLGADLRARQDPDAALVLRLLGDAEGWAALAKVLEVVESDVGGEKGIVENRWATGQELRAFSQEANAIENAVGSGRHANPKYRARSSERLTLKEAQDLVHRVVRAWLPSKR